MALALAFASLAAVALVMDASQTCSPFRISSATSVSSAARFTATDLVVVLCVAVGGGYKWQRGLGV